MNDIGKNIKAKREQLGITQENLALALGYKSKTSINKIEMGLADVPRAKLPAFACALCGRSVYHTTSCCLTRVIHIVVHIKRGPRSELRGSSETPGAAAPELLFSHKAASDQDPHASAQKGGHYEGQCCSDPSDQHPFPPFFLAMSASSHFMNVLPL